VTDWASVDPRAATLNAVAAVLPGSAGAPAAGLDATRVAIESAESCVAADRRVAARLWPRLQAAPGRARYAPDGAALTTDRHAASLVGAAAAAHAAGKLRSSHALLGSAEALEASRPTYYGAAWVALGRVMLDSTALGGCST
jgi:endoglucanase